jgi:hypothetical protein
LKGLRRQSPSFEAKRHFGYRDDSIAVLDSQGQILSRDRSSEAFGYDRNEVVASISQQSRRKAVGWRMPISKG